MTIKGQVNFVGDPTSFFAPILLGGSAPSTGFGPALGLLFVTIGGGVKYGGASPGILPTWSVGAYTNPFDGTFEVLDIPDGDADSFRVIVGIFGVPLYRSEFFPITQAEGGLNIYLYQPTLPKSAGITAGTISGVLSSGGLPGNTQITATPWGLNLSGSESQANIQFGVSIVPDRSPNLGVYLDVALSSWNINVGWPESWCESADDILSQIRSGLQSADSSVNQTVQQKILTVLQGMPVNLSKSLASKFLSAVSVQFASLTFDNNYSWAASNESDPTVVITPIVLFGYPRRW